MAQETIVPKGIGSHSHISVTQLSNEADIYIFEAAFFDTVILFVNPMSGVVSQTLTV